MPACKDGGSANRVGNWGRKEASIRKKSVALGRTLVQKHTDHLFFPASGAWPFWLLLLSSGSGWDKIVHVEGAVFKVRVSQIAYLGCETVPLNTARSSSFPRLLNKLSEKHTAGPQWFISLPSSPACKHLGEFPSFGLLMLFPCLRVESVTASPSPLAAPLRVLGLKGQGSLFIRVLQRYPGQHHVAP